jgi:hypothetical protein
MPSPASARAAAYSGHRNAKLQGMKPPCIRLKFWGKDDRFRAVVPHKRDKKCSHPYTHDGRCIFTDVVIMQYRGDLVRSSARRQPSTD